MAWSGIWYDLVKALPHVKVVQLRFPSFESEDVRPTVAQLLELVALVFERWGR
jgi:hypothetical protein